MEKRQNEGYSCHDEHVSENGAGRQEHIRERVGNGRTPFTHALHQNAQILFEQDDIRSILGHIYGTLNGHANISSMKRLGIIHAFQVPGASQVRGCSKTPVRPGPFSMSSVMKCPLRLPEQRNTSGQKK